jgi:YD repeat-containing protein
LNLYNSACLFLFQSISMKKNTMLFVVLVFILFTGCRKETEELPSGIFLSKVIYHQNVDQIRHYYYNSQGLLSAREFTFDGRMIEKFQYKYDKSILNRIDFHEIRSHYDLTIIPKGYMIVGYESGKIIKITLIPDNFTITYSYNTRDQIIKVASTSSDYTLYDYNQNGNIIGATVYKDEIEYWKFFYEYDNMNNPFYNVDPIHESFGKLDLIRYKCPNNLVKSVFINENQDTISESEFVYQYDSNNLPVKSYELYTSEINGYYRDSVHTQLYLYEMQ